MRALRGFGYAVIRALTKMRRDRGGALWAIGIVAAGFILLGLVHLVTHNLDGLTERLGGAHMVVYLDDEVSAERADAITAAVAALPAVESHSFVGRREALDRLRATLDDEDLVAGLEVGMLPASIEVVLANGVRDVAAIHPIVTRLEATAGVESVEVTDRWIDRLAALQTGLRRASWVLLALVGGICIFFVAAALGLRFRSRRRDVEVLDLVGASQMFIRGPLVIEGVVQGALGAAVALLALWFLFHMGAGSVSLALSNVFDTPETLAFLPPAHVVLLVASGGALGLIGALLATRRHEMA